MWSVSGRCLAFFGLWALVLLCGACSGAQPSKLSTQFPTKAELDAIIEADVRPELSAVTPVKTVERWQLSGPFPELIGARQKHIPEHYWERVFARALPREISLTQEAMCAARELGRFYAHEGVMPNESLERFILSRCGVDSTSTSFKMKSWSRDERLSLEAQFKQVDSEWLSEFVREDRPRDYGIWLGGDGERQVVVLFRFYRDIAIEPLSRQMNERGEVVIRGELLNEDEDVVHGMINRGDYGFAECDEDESVKLPKFELRCKGNPGDTFAYFTVSTGRDSDEFLSTVMVQQVWGAVAPMSEYRASTVRQLLAEVIPDERSDAASVMAQVLAGANHVRAHLQYPPIELSAAQSARVERAVPFVFGSVAELSEEEARALKNKVIRGLKAGWDVGAPISRGSFSFRAAWADQVVDVVATMLELPEGRDLLLRRAPSLLAVGSVVQDGHVVVAAFSYERAIPQDYYKLSGRLSVELSKQRRAAGRKGFKRLSSFNSVAAELSEDVVQGRLSFDEAVKKLAYKLRSGLGTGSWRFVMMQDSMSELRFHDELIQQESLSGAVLAVMHKPEGSPWWIYELAIIRPW